MGTDRLQRNGQDRRVLDRMGLERNFFPTKKNTMASRYEYSISDFARLNKVQKGVLLKWLHEQPDFRTRRPHIDDLIAEFRRKDSPLNCLAENSVQRAARQYWRERAQYLLRHIDVTRVEITTKMQTGPVRAYVAITTRGGSVPEENYIPMQRVANNTTLKHTVLQHAEADFLAWLSRYEKYSEFLDEFSEVIAAYRKVEKRRESIAS